MAEMNGITTHMTEAERRLLRTLKQHPTVIPTLPCYPSDEFMCAAAFLNPHVLGAFSNQNPVACMIAAKLDYTTEPLIHGITPEIRAALDEKNTHGIMGADLSHQDIELYAHLMNVMKFGPAAGHLYPRKR